MTPKPRPPASRALAGRMAAGAKAEAAKPGRPDFPRRITLDLPEDLYSALREAAFRAGPATLPMTCLIRAITRTWIESPPSAETRRVLEIARAEAALIRARK
jgi:hypothetical protein